MYNPNHLLAILLMLAPAYFVVQLVIAHIIVFTKVSKRVSSKTMANAIMYCLPSIVIVAMFLAYKAFLKKEISEQYRIDVFSVHHDDKSHDCNDSFHSITNQSLPHFTSLYFTQ